MVLYFLTSSALEIGTAITVWSIKQLYNGAVYLLEPSVIEWLMEKDIADLDPLEKIAKTSAERVKKIEAIESLIDGAYIKQRFF